MIFPLRVLIRWILLLSTGLCSSAHAAPAPDWVTSFASDSRLGSVQSSDRILLQDFNVHFDSGNDKTEITRRYVFLVGRDGRFADFELVESVQGKRNLDWEGAWIIAPDRSLKRADRKALTFNSQFSGAVLYSDDLIAIWTFNNLQTGTIIAIEYAITEEHLIDLTRLAVQSEEMIADSTVIRVAGDASDSATLRVVNAGKTIFVETPGQMLAGSAPKWMHRAFDGGYEASAARVDVYYRGVRGGRRDWTWPEVASRVTQMWNPVKREISDQSVQAIMPRLHADVSLDVLRRDYEKQFRYVAVEIGEGNWIPHDPQAVAGCHYGDCKDLSLMLAEVWKQRGIETCPVLVSVPFSRPFDREFPTPWQFNHCILAVVEKGDTVYYDPTARGYVWGELAQWAQGCPALWIKPDCDLTFLPRSNAPAEYVTELSGDLTSKGEIVGTLVSRSDSRFDGTQRLEFSRDEVYKQVRTLVRSLFPVEMENFAFEDGGRSLTTRVRVSRFVDATPSQAVWNPCPFNVSLPDSASSDLSGGYYFEEPFQLTHRLSVRIPSGWAAPTPRDTIFSTFAGSISTKQFTRNDSLLAEWQVSIREQHYPRAQKAALDSLLRAANQVYECVEVVRK